MGAEAHDVANERTRGLRPGPEAATTKLFLSQHLRDTGDLVVELACAGGTLDHDSAPDQGAWQQAFLGQWASRIGAGTDDIQRNALGERVLGLPGEPRPDKDVPFAELRRSGIV